jgi:hypothetical protein
LPREGWGMGMCLRQLVVRVTSVVVRVTWVVALFGPGAKE